MDKKVLVFALIFLVLFSAVALASNDTLVTQKQNQDNSNELEDDTGEKRSLLEVILPSLLTMPIIIIALLTAIASSRSASAAEKAVKASHKAREGQMVMKIKDVEGSAQMLNTMVYLVGWVEERDKDGIDWLKEFGDSRQDSSRYCQIKKVDECRRMFHYHYVGINILKKHGLLSEDMVKDLRSTHQKDFYEQLVKPLTDQIVVKVTKEWPELTVDYPEGYFAKRKLRDIEQKKINGQKKK